MRPKRTSYLVGARPEGVVGGLSPGSGVSYSQFVIEFGHEFRDTACAGFVDGRRHDFGDSLAEVEKRRSGGSIWIGSDDGLTLVATFDHCRIQRDLSKERNSGLLGQFQPAADAEKVVGFAVVAHES